MKPLPLGILLASGLLVGSVAQRLVSRPASVETRERKATKFIREEAVAPVVPASADTVESLKDPHAPQRISRTALWLEDASLADIEALWKEVCTEWPPPGELMSLLLARWVMIDPAHALANGTYNGGNTLAWAAWAELDSKAAYEAARAKGDAYAINAVVKTMALRDPDYVFGLLEKGEDIDLGPGTSLVNGFLARGQYERAIQAFQRFGAAGSESTERIFTEWVKKEPEAALQWLMQNPRAVSAGFTDDRPMLALVSSHPEQSREMLAKLPTGQVKSRLEKAMVRQLALEDPAAARKLAERNPVLAQRAELLALAGITGVGSKPEESVAILRGILDLGVPPTGLPVSIFRPGGIQKCPDPHSLVPYLVETVARSAPAAMLDEIMIEPDKATYRQAADEIAELWMAGDAWEFSKWLKEQPAGKARDGFALALAQRIGIESEKPAFKEALQWAASVSPSVERETGVSQLVQSWRRDDEGALESYLASPDAPAVVKEIARKLETE